MSCCSIYPWFLKNPITFFVIMVVSDGELETKENKIQTKGTNRPFALRGHVTSFL